MARKQKSKKILAVVVLMLLMFAFTPAVNVNAEIDSENISLKVKAGFNDIAKLGCNTVVRVTVANSGESFSGEVQVFVRLNENQRTVYAVPADFPKDSSKEIRITVPVNSAKKDLEVRITKGSKTVESQKYEFSKIIAPSTPVIGILSDDPEGYRSIKGIKLEEVVDPRYRSEYVLKYRASRVVISSSGTTQIVSEVVFPDTPAEVVEIDAENMPEEEGLLSGIDIIVIGNFDTSSLTKAQCDVLEKWVDNGGTLILAGGPNAGKVYSGLQDGLKPFTIQGPAVSVPASALGTFTEKTFSEGTISVVQGNKGDGEVLIKHDETPLAINYRKGKGVISVLTFDPSLSPVSNWENVSLFWQKYLKETSAYMISNSALDQDYLGGLSRDISDFQYMASRVPEDQLPPFKMLLVIIGVYILIVGPILYLLLKWKDKRDLNWVVLPAAALIFLVIIYVAGFKTRYSEAVMNSISVINLNSESKQAEISTIIGAFNNERSNMKIEYDNSLNIDFNPNNYYYYDYYYYSYPYQNNANFKTVSKLLIGEEPVYELYDVSMWEPRFITVKKTEPFEGETVRVLSINNGIMKVNVKNNTNFDFYEGFIAVGKNLVDVGDIPAGQEKTIEVDMNSFRSYGNVDTFLNQRYIQNNTSGKLSKDYALKSWKRDLMSQAYYYAQSTQSAYNNLNLNVLFMAFNYNDPGYDIVINDKEPKKYNTNIVMANAVLKFESGEQIQIPAGIMEPSAQSTTDSININYFSYDGEEGMIAYGDGSINFSFDMPSDIDISQISVKWPYVDASIYTTGIYYNPQQTVTTLEKDLDEVFEFYVFNCVTGEWEKVSKEFTISENVSNYINNVTGRFMVSIKVDTSNPDASTTGFGRPEIQISGVVK